MVEVKPLRLGRWKMSSYVFSEILPVWSLISLMCVVLGSYGEVSVLTTIQATLKTLSGQNFGSQSFAAWVGLRRLCSARCRADLNGSNVKMFGWPLRMYNR